MISIDKLEIYNKKLITNMNKARSQCKRLPGLCESSSLTFKLFERRLQVLNYTLNDLLIEVYNLQNRVLNKNNKVISYNQTEHYFKSYHYGIIDPLYGKSYKTTYLEGNFNEQEISMSVLIQQLQTEIEKLDTNTNDELKVIIEYKNLIFLH